jgi:UDP-N-acetylglucosamine 2-epimerase (non-hydrolysing)
MYRGEKLKLLFIFGTRPEAIKMAPLILRAKEDTSFDVRVCVTGQHKKILYQVLDFFAITADHDLNVMQPDQSLFDVTADILRGLQSVLVSENPDIVLVQGDTTTAFIGALAAFYMKIPVAHIEAGLRSHNNFSPFPEEINRKLVGVIADYHFAPTARAKENLLNEGKALDATYVVGNTVIDALRITLEVVNRRDTAFKHYFNYLDLNKKTILVTGHRRESFGGPFREMCFSLKDLAKRQDVEIVYPVHLNPNVRRPVSDILARIDNIHLIEPLEYPYLIWLMNKSFLILTDSGGIQEEAPGFGKPVLVMRDITERMEGIEAGTCRLVGTNRKAIVKEASRLLEDTALYGQMAVAVNPYGDGKSAERILGIIKKKSAEIEVCAARI